MAIVNRTPDSFYDRGATWAFSAALERVHAAVAQGADLVDLGGVPAGAGAEVGVDEELRRVVGLVAAVREAHPDLVISVDTWRHEVAGEVCAAGADLLNDAWGGYDELVAEVAAAYDVGLVCTHTGGLAPPSAPPRSTAATQPTPPPTQPTPTPPPTGRPAYDDLMADVVGATVALAERAVGLGVDPRSILLDPGHDFGKTTRESLEVTRRLEELVDTGWPVLVALSRKDFIGETLGLPVEDRLPGSLAAAAVCAWLGARVIRAHDVAATRQAVDLVAAVRMGRDADPHLHPPRAEPDRPAPSPA